MGKYETKYFDILKKKKGISQVYFCVFVRPDCCDQDNWEPVTLCCTVNAC